MEFFSWPSPLSKFTTSSSQVTKEETSLTMLDLISGGQVGRIRVAERRLDTKAMSRAESEGSLKIKKSKILSQCTFMVSQSD